MKKYPALHSLACCILLLVCGSMVFINSAMAQTGCGCDSVVIDGPYTSGAPGLSCSGGTGPCGTCGNCSWFQITNNSVCPRGEVEFTDTTSSNCYHLCAWVLDITQHPPAWVMWTSNLPTCQTSAAKALPSGAAPLLGPSGGTMWVCLCQVNTPGDVFEVQVYDNGVGQCVTYKTP
jgi:hypothetical protein